MASLSTLLQSHLLSSQQWAESSFAVRQDSTRRSAHDILRLNTMSSMSALLPLIPSIADYSPAVQRRVYIEAVYAPYVRQQAAVLRSLLKDEQLRLPVDLDYESIFGLSTEERAALMETRPESIGQARRIEGVTASGALRLMALLKGQGRRRRPVGQEPGRGAAAAAAADLGGIDIDTTVSQGSMDAGQDAAV